MITTLNPAKSNGKHNTFSQLFFSGSSNAAFTPTRGTNASTNTSLPLNATLPLVFGGAGAACFAGYSYLRGRKEENATNASNTTSLTIAPNPVSQPQQEPPLAGLLAPWQKFSTAAGNLASYVKDASSTAAEVISRPVQTVSQQLSQVIEREGSNFFDFFRGVKGVELSDFERIPGKLRLGNFDRVAEVIKIDLAQTSEYAAKYGETIEKSVRDSLLHESLHARSAASGLALKVGSTTNELMIDAAALRVFPDYTAEFAQNEVKAAGTVFSSRIDEFMKVPAYTKVLGGAAKILGKVAYPLAAGIPIATNVYACTKNEKPCDEAAADAGKEAVANVGGVWIGAETTAACLEVGGVAHPIGWLACAGAGIIVGVVGTKAIESAINSIPAAFDKALDETAVGTERYEAGIRPGMMSPEFEMPPGGVPYEVTAVPKTNSTFWSAINTTAP